MALRVGQPNFSKGEIGEELVSRIDVAAYQVGLRRARNVTILKYGGITKRPGTRLVAEVYDASQPVRLVPFQFSLEQTYALEMGQGYMRAAANGGMVIEERITITSVTFGATTTIEAAFHEYAAGDQVYFDGVEGMVELNGRIGRVLSVADASHFTVDIDSSAFSPFTSDTGGGGNYCVTADTPILMADGSERIAHLIHVGDMVRTRHEDTMAWGDYPVTAISFRSEAVWRAEGYPRATPAHRFWQDRWIRMDEIGEPDGNALVALITVADAQTYVSAGVLSHNIKQRMPDE